MRDKIDLQGHRGARGLFPENTMEGFAATLAVGVDAFELDVAITADGVPVVSHDAALNPDIARGSDGAWLPGAGPLIRSLRADELQAYDVGRLRPGSDYARQFPDQIPCDGARIPRLAEVLAIDPLVRFTIELKTYPDHPDWTVRAEAMAEAVLAVVDAAGGAGRVILESFDWRGPRYLRLRRPGLKLAWLTSPQTVGDAACWWGGPTPADFGGSVPRAVSAEGGQIWAPQFATLSAASIEEAHGLGLEVLPWTVNAADDMRRLLRAGVDGLITDRPDIARSVIAEAGLPLPPSRP
jgi:glycerophosphoryl diester phosphodiesterase